MMVSMKMCNQDFIDLIIDAAVQGAGIACLTEVQADELVRAGKLVRMLDDWRQSFPGYHIYYQERKDNSAAFKLFIDRLKRYKY
jgi:DNA-binding transcriptional LysR family regulator